jgi:hypothetical protein
LTDSVESSTSTARYLDGSLTLVKRRKPEVGDVVNSRRELQDLPADSVVVNCYDQPMIVRNGGTFSYDGVLHPFAARNNAPYRVVHIPAR